MEAPLEGPPDVSLAPVVAAWTAFVLALANWVVNVTVRLPRYLVFGGRRARGASQPALRPVSSEDALGDGALDYEEPDGTPRGWVERNPGLGGFRLEVQLAEGGPFEPVRCNSPEPVPLENAYFAGRMLFLLNTAPEDPAHAAHLAGKPRMFEMQIQGRCKERPTDGLLSLGAELATKPKLSFVTSTLVKGVMSFVQRRTSGLEWSFGGKGVTPFCAFPLTSGVDYLAATNPGDAPPALGGVLPEAQASRDARRSPATLADVQRLGDEATYSLSFYSSFIDFAGWRGANLPMGSPSLDSMVGDQPIDVVVFDHKPGGAPGEKRYWFRYRCRWDAELAAFARSPALVAKHARRLEHGLGDGDGAARASIDETGFGYVRSGEPATFAACAGDARPGLRRRTSGGGARTRGTRSPSPPSSSSSRGPARASGSASATLSASRPKATRTSASPRPRRRRRPSTAARCCGCARWPAAATTRRCGCCPSRPRPVIIPRPSRRTTTSASRSSAARARRRPATRPGSCRGPTPRASSSSWTAGACA